LSRGRNVLPEALGSQERGAPKIAPMTSSVMRHTPGLAVAGGREGPAAPPPPINGRAPDGSD